MVSENQEEKILKETKLLVDLFLLTHASDIELSNMTDISSSTVGRRLTNKEYITKCFKEKGLEIFENIARIRQENLLNGKKKGGQTTLINHVYVKDETGKFNGSVRYDLSLIFKNVNNQYNFLVHAALRFRLHLKTLSEMFQIDEEELYKNLRNHSGTAFKSLIYLFNHDGTDQEMAKEKFVEYYRELYNASVAKKDIAEKKRLLDLIGDKKALEFKKRHKSGDKLSTEDIVTILEYQLKYAITSRIVERTFDIEKVNYLNRVYKYFETDNRLQSQFERLTEHNRSLGRGIKR